MSTGMNIFVIFLIVVNIAGCAWLLVANRRVKVDPSKEKQSLGHAFDGIEELNNPLPAWWTWLFVLTIVFGVVFFSLVVQAPVADVLLERIDREQDEKSGDPG